MLTTFRAWTGNTVAPDAEWQRVAAWTGTVDVDRECDLWGTPGPLLYGSESPDTFAEFWKHYESLTDNRARIFCIIDRSPASWLLTTRYPGRVLEGWFEQWKYKPNSNVTLLVPAQTQAEYDAIIPELLKCEHLCRIGLDLRWPKERIIDDHHVWEERIGIIRLAPGEGEPCATCRLEETASTHFGIAYHPYRPAYTASLTEQARAAGVETLEG